MAPLPCSPVSNSTASEQSTQPSEESDDSLITPRPGPSDPSQRTAANLSRPQIPTHVPLPLTEEGQSQFAAQGGRINQSTDGRPRNPFTYGSDSGRRSVGSLEQRVESPKSREQPLSTTFLPRSPTSTPMRDLGGSSALSLKRHSSNESPSRGKNYLEETESSADENTGIVRSLQRKPSRSNGYGATNADANNMDEQARGYDGAAEEEINTSKRKPGVNKSRTTLSSGPDRTRAAGRREKPKSWLIGLADRYGSVELENKGSVARDHLALERTFLAWVRTSLSFASIGIAVTQLFRLNTALAQPEPTSPADSEQQTSRAGTARLQSVGKPLGATFIGISILILLLGFHRFFESQHYVINGKFPASRGSIVLVSLVTIALIVASFVVVIAVAPGALET